MGGEIQKLFTWKLPLFSTEKAKTYLSRISCKVDGIKARTRRTQ